MLVYGDRPRTRDPREALAAIQARLSGLEQVSPGIERHARLVAALIEAGQLAQGLADAEFDARGGDAPSPPQDAAMALVMQLARAVAASWTSDYTALPPDLSAEIAALAAQPLPPRVTLKTPEGYAFYAVYPEAYLEAAWELPEPPQVIGLRSIGTSLAAMVAVGAGAAPPMTLRPAGHPFARELKLLEPIPDAAAYAVVDEGPGLSGSSFGAVADALEGRRITFFPSHDGDLGPHASEAHRARWATATRLSKTFDELIPPRLPGWFADLLGEAPLEDLGGGKYRLGDWRLKFSGLGAIGEGKLARARALHAAGFTAEPLALRHGFLAERWHEHTEPTDRAALLDTLARYLAFRASAFPATPEDGAALDALREMALHNAAEAGLRIHVPAYDGPVRPVRTDNRLHARKWMQLPGGRILKADALDHDDAHDLIGCQDITWDAAGAQVELALTPNETAALTAAIGADPALVAFCRPCYAAFQLGAATLQGHTGEISRYRAALNAN
ncbi:MAG TPA: hypothetical protein VD906_02785 [Caulobacteraceae bacterium]|nr:hypothetical protein [Caulobacteraceae bacterium]